MASSLRTPPDTTTGSPGVNERRPVPYVSIVTLASSSLLANTVAVFGFMGLFGVTENAIRSPVGVVQVLCWFHSCNGYDGK